MDMLQITVCLALLGLVAVTSQDVSAQQQSFQRYAPVKALAFVDPNTNYLYQVVSHNATQVAASSNRRAFIKVSRQKIRSSRDRTPVSDLEFVQTIPFTAPLVDFDLQCLPSHCYLVAVTIKSRQNVELYAWQRTQFDLQAKRDSFARAAEVRIFRVESSLYIAIAQEQLQLSPYKLAQDYEEPVRFIGCAILKFNKGHEHDVRYHQFIRLPFNPQHVHHFRSKDTNHAAGLVVTQPIENHYLVFSVYPNWVDSDPNQSRSFIWSPLDDYFWPHRMPQGTQVVPNAPGQPAAGAKYVQFPSPPPLMNQTGANRPQDYVSPTETCLHQLQRLLSDRDHQARQLLQSAKSIWRSSPPNAEQLAGRQLTNISAQVIVHGNVTVLGSVIESPQISLIAGRSAPMAEEPSAALVGHLINTHSPAIVENKFKQALIKLEHMRQKVAQAVLANLPPQSTSSFSNQIRFFGTVEAEEVIFTGIDNSNVHLNGIPFKQLEQELISLRGPQNIGTKIVFDGRVTADVLEIHGSINDYYYLKDALDIKSDQVQVIDASGHNYVSSRLSAIEFQSISAPEVAMARNATINTISLADFITRDDRTQLVVGRKSFKRLSMGKLDLANPNVLLNDFNIYQLATNAILLSKPFQTISGFPVTFLRNVQAKRLTLNNFINKHINLTSLVHDSVKSNDVSLQQIHGRKNFLSPLQIDRLTTEGALNGVKVDQIFNLNYAPPTTKHYQFANGTGPYEAQHDVPITGEFIFRAPVAVQGSLNVGLVNGIDLGRRAIRRFPMSQAGSVSPQPVRGHKMFFKPVRVINSIRLLDLQEARKVLGNNTQFPYPLVNKIDLREIITGLVRQKEQPSKVYVDNLEIDGNLNLPDLLNLNGSSRISLGNFANCPLNLIRKRLVLAGGEEQVIESPISVNSLRARSIQSSLTNGFRFPQEFVMRSPAIKGQSVVEPIYGRKFVDRLIVSPPNLVREYGPPRGAGERGIILGEAVSINQVNHGALQTFIMNERKHNSTGEKVFNSMTVYGNLYANRINGNRWPEDILLKSVSSSGVSGSAPWQHKRIYSHLVFLNTSSLQIANQLVLRGPIQLNGRVNGVNLTEFARQSATYGDKDLYSTGRPIRNKIFLGGLTVKGEIRAQGLIDGVNFDEMRRRTVLVKPSREPTVITSYKMFASDATFQSPTSVNYLDDVPMQQYLRRVQYQPSEHTLRVSGKKTVTGVLRINKNLYVRGLINGVDFAELRAKAISLAPTDELEFNRTLTVEGDVFMDNLWIDERNGTIDGVKLTNLVPIGAPVKNELVLQAPRVDRRADPFGRVLNVAGSFLDCQVSCNLQLLQPRPSNKTSPAQWPQRGQPQPTGPVFYPTQSVMVHSSRPAFVEHPRNFTLTRTTPPYSLASTYQPPMSSTAPARFATPTSRPPVYQQPLRQQQQSMGQVSSLVQRTPVAVNYEQRAAPVRRFSVPAETNAIVNNHLENLRHHIVSLNLIRTTSSSDIVIGFIGMPTNDVSNLELGEGDNLHSDHIVQDKSFLQLDQIDFPFNQPTVYHLSVGVSTDRFGLNVTNVLQSLGTTQEAVVSNLPVQFPNSAMFLKGYKILFLLISQDYSINTGMCAPASVISKHLLDNNRLPYSDSSTKRAESGIHVYTFIALHNSSSFAGAYFDLYQTIDLPGIDSFDKFNYKDSTYVLAISRSVGRIYLLMLRGYSGFQLVSHVDTPNVERVTVMFTHDRRPILMVQQTDGLHRLLEPVII